VAIIDLTDTNRYYKGSDVPKNVSYNKLNIQGQQIPPQIKIQKFIDLINKYQDKKGYIAVHCTHGLNRTGFLVVSYMIQQLKMSMTDAISAFNIARPPGLHKIDYIRALYEKYDPKNPKKNRFDLYPPTPTWSKHYKQYLAKVEESKRKFSGEIDREQRQTKTETKNITIKPDKKKKDVSEEEKPKIVQKTELKTEKKKKDDTSEEENQKITKKPEKRKKDVSDSSEEEIPAKKNKKEPTTSSDSSSDSSSSDSSSCDASSVSSKDRKTKQKKTTILGSCVPLALTWHAKESIARLEKYQKDPRMTKILERCEAILKEHFANADLGRFQVTIKRDFFATKPYYIGIIADILVARGYTVNTKLCKSSDQVRFTVKSPTHHSAKKIKAEKRYPKE
jgi:hypothetical protein